jgi:ABC-type antimicrobial peptide transport system permease subunit
MATVGIAAGIVVGFALARIAGGYLQEIRLPGVVPLLGSAFVLLTAAVVASVLPAARAARVDVMQALRTE